ncbi:MAG: fasciclin domain-containing protein [Prevotella sp.]|nr:fasciclin domain-containing protein [Prevotella sp.]
MKTVKQTWKRSLGSTQRHNHRQWVMALAVALTCGAGLTSCDKYDLDEKDPEGWGSSIYSWLYEQGNYSNTVKLIDDLGYREVLAKTGSKTLFVADDAAFERFYQKNNWGARSYDQLTTPQKKMLLFGSMIDNSIQMNNLSTIQGTPLREGQCMRRFSALSEFDSVPILKPSDMPDNRFWKRHRDSGKNMVCLEDGTSVPMLLFLEAQMVNNRITNDDYNFLFNNSVNRQSGDASVNGINVVEQNIRCANGFIHRTDEVVTPLPNMAELIASKPQVSIFNRIMERFCAPYPDSKDLAKTIQYNYLYDQNIDTIYTKRFFNEKNTMDVRETPDGGRVPARLLFDPEWNSYYSASIKSTGDGNAAEQRDMAVMMVPTDEAMKAYWEGAGKPLSENFASWDDVDDETIIKLLNVNMLPSFISSVPSKFNGILNDANDPMGVSTADVDSVWMACNGAVYLTNKVFSPTEYVSVLFPPLINRTMKIIYWAITQCKYNVYLNALGSDYSFFVPTNNALLEYIDPCSYGKETLQLLSFRWNENAKDVRESVYAVIYNYDPISGIRDSLEETRNYDRIVSCLKDILDTHIVIGKVWDGEHTYFRTKNGSGIRVLNATDEPNMTVEGSFQMNEGHPLHISRIYDQRKEVSGGNGKVYVLDGQPIMGTRMTVRDQLAAHPNYFGKFLELLDGSGLFETVHNLGTGNEADNKACGGDNLSVFNTYHYTIYVPSNDAIEAMQASGQLSSWEKVEEKREAGNIAGADNDSVNIIKFLRYHIQDNALYIGAEQESGDFETSLINSRNRFCMLKTKLLDDEIQVQDTEDIKNGTHHTVTKQTYVEDGKVKPLYNIQAREYLYNGNDASTATVLYTTSTAVIHLIDKPLIYTDGN